MFINILTHSTVPPAPWKISGSFKGGKVAKAVVFKEKCGAKLGFLEGGGGGGANRTIFCGRGRSSGHLDMRLTVGIAVKLLVFYCSK